MIQSLFEQKYPGQWRCEMDDTAWLVWDDKSVLAVFCPDGRYVAVGAILAESTDLDPLARVAAIESKKLTTGRLYASEGTGKYLLLLEDYVPPERLSGENGMTLLWQSIGVMMIHYRTLAWDVIPHVADISPVSMADENMWFLTMTHV